MTKTSLFATAAIMTSLMVTPVLAQSMRDGQGMRETAQTTSKMKKQQIKNRTMRMSDRRSNGMDRYDDRMGFNDGYARSNTGFFPVDAAAGIVGGAVATAGAISTAPFGGTYDAGYRYDNRYSYNDGYAVDRGYRGSYAAVVDNRRVGAFATAPYTNPYEVNRIAPNDGWNNGWYGQSYSQRNGFVCEPGTVFTNANGIRTLCQ